MSSVVESSIKANLALKKLNFKLLKVKTEKYFKRDVNVDYSPSPHRNRKQFPGMTF
jgi:hypothetical protein